jgi:hypothetical protein
LDPLRATLGLLVLLAPACSDDTIAPEPAELTELCGEVGSVQILALDPDRPLALVQDHGIFSGRRILDVRYRGEGPASGAFPALGDGEVWSMGLCGEDPMLLADDNPRLIDYYGQVGFDVLLECDVETGRMSTLDPTGELSANLVFETHGCFAWPTDDGLLTILPHDDDTGALVFQPWPDDPYTAPAEQIVLLDPVRMHADMPHTGPAEWEVLGVTDDDYLAITTDDELVAISRVDAELTTIATDVREFEADSTGRYVVWQSTVVTNDDPDWPEGPISLLDRQTDQVTLLTEGALAHTIHSVFTLESMDILHMRVESNSIDRFYRLPTLESVDSPTDISVYTAVDETRALIGDYFIGGPYVLFDTVTGEQTVLYEGDGQVTIDESSFTLLAGVDCCFSDNSTRKPGTLLRIPYEGEREVLARRATFGHRFTTDGRVITPIDVGPDWVGSLIVVDPDTLDEQLIDHDVFSFSASANDEIEGDPVVVYTVVDPERQGVWLARLAE